MAMIVPIVDKGKREWVLDMSVTDGSGTLFSTSFYTYYILSYLVQAHKKR